MGVPSSEAVPLSGLSIPAATLSRVLFPQPLGPTTTTNSPGWVVMLTPRSAGTLEPSKFLSILLRTSRPRWLACWGVGGADARRVMLRIVTQCYVNDIKLLLSIMHLVQNRKIKEAGRVLLLFGEAQIVGPLRVGLKSLRRGIFGEFDARQGLGGDAGF